MEVLLTEKRIIANRHNAVLGGVKTAAGKAVSRRNALQHGILSKETIINKGDLRENPREFKQLRDQLFSELSPVGTVETMLVDEILGIYWRKRRIMRIESSLIEQQLLGFKLKGTLQRGEQSMHNSQMAEIYFNERIKTSAGCAQLLKEVKQITSHLKKEGLPLPEMLEETLRSELGVADGFPLAKNIHMFHMMVKHAQELQMPEQGKKNLTRLAIESSKQYEQFLEIGEGSWKRVEEDGDEVGMETKLLPSEKDLNRIQRYESHLHKLFMQNLHELQRMQAMRLGKPVALPQALDLNLNSENGFVS